MDCAEPGEAPGRLRIELTYSPAPRLVRTMTLSLPPGSRLSDALRCSGLLESQGWALETLICGIWSHVQPLHHSLRDGDRVEIYRPLTVDPKEARRLRYKRHRQRSAAGA